MYRVIDEADHMFAKARTANGACAVLGHLVEEVAARTAPVGEESLEMRLLLRLVDFPGRNAALFSGCPTDGQPSTTPMARADLEEA